MSVPSFGPVDFGHGDPSPGSRIPDVAWTLILPYLCLPIPAPLSIPPRSTFRPPLATAMRVSKLFQSICEPLLFTHLITDRFSRVISNLHLPSVRRRLGMIRSLHIEYEEKGREPSYSDICGNGAVAWGMIGAAKSKAEKGIMAECERELVELEAILSAVNKLGSKAVFPKLESIAISSLYGRDSDDMNELVWKRHEQTFRDSFTLSSVTMSCYIEWEIFIESLPLKHFCMRDDNGPLRMKRISHASKNEGPIPPCSTIYHFGYEYDHLPLPLGRHINWVSDVPMMEDWSIPLEYFGYFMLDNFQLRESLAEDRNRPDVADVDIYLSTSYASPPLDPATAMEFRLFEPATGRRLSFKHQEMLMPMLEETIRDLMKEHRWEDGHKIRWHASTQTPTCGACGSGVPGSRAGMWATGKYVNNVVEVDLTKAGTMPADDSGAGEGVGEDTVML